jgi:hypothetical protein
VSILAVRFQMAVLFNNSSAVSSLLLHIYCNCFIVLLLSISVIFVSLPFNCFHVVPIFTSLIRILLFVICISFVTSSSNIATPCDQYRTGFGPSILATLTHCLSSLLCIWLLAPWDYFKRAVKPRVFGMCFSVLMAKTSWDIYLVLSNLKCRWDI